PAISLAENGVPLTFKNVEFFEAARPTLARSPEAQRLYLGNGGPRPGRIVTYKELASTFRQVAEGGAEVFYRGPIARAVARAVREAGGWLGEEDLAAFAPEWREPATITYRDRQVFSMPPPFSAFQMLETLNILEGYDLKGFRHNSVDYLHHLIEAVKLGSADRLAYAYGDVVPIGGLLSKKYAASQRARIDGKRAAVSEGERHNPEKLHGQIAEGHPASFMNEHTTHFACADGAGHVVSVTTPQMLLNVLEFGMNIQEAIEAPRVRVYRDRLVDAESRISPETRAGLVERGHDVHAIDDWSWIVGGGQGIVRDPESGVLMAGADPRRDGYALDRKS